MEKLHTHKLSPTDICCAEHAYDMCKIYKQRRKTDETISVILNFRDALDTQFILDPSSNAVKIKLSLATISNEYALKKAGEKDYSLAIYLLETAEMLLGGVNTETGHGLLATTLSNLAYISYAIGDLEAACEYINSVADSQGKFADTTGDAITKINKSAILLRLGACHEAWYLAKDAVSLLEPKINTFYNNFSETELSDNREFLENLEFCLIGYINIISSLENLKDAKHQKDIQETRNRAFIMTEHYLGGHHLFKKLGRATVNHHNEIRARINISPHSEVRVPSSAPQSIPVINTNNEYSQRKIKENHLVEIVKKQSFFENPSIVSYENQLIKEGSDNILLPANYSFKHIHMPNAPLPKIPVRPSWRRDLYSYTSSGVKKNTTAASLFAGAVPDFLLYSEEDIQYVFQNGDTAHLVICKLYSHVNEPYFTIFSDGKELSETIKLSEFPELFKYLCLSDVFPPNELMKFITNFKKFVQYFVFPFVRLTPLSSPAESIELWPQAINLIKAPISVLFLKTYCKITVVSLQENCIRMVISSIEEDEYYERCVRIDIHFDKETKGQVAVYHNTSNREGVFCPSIKQLNLTSDNFGSIKDEVELLIEEKFKGITFDEFVDEKPLLLLKVTIFSNNLIKLLWSVEEMKRQRHWLITAKNLDKPGTLPTLYEYSYLQIQKNFGIRVNRLNSHEKQLIAFYVLETMKLETNSFEDFGSQESGWDDCLMSFPTTVVINYRILLEKAYFVPVTLSLIAANEIFIGVKASIYNLDTCLNSGCLLIAQESFYRKENVRSEKQPKRSFNKIHMKLRQETKFFEMLNDEKGWLKITSALQVNGDEICLYDNDGDICYIDSLETILSEKYNGF